MWLWLHLISSKTKYTKALFKSKNHFIRAWISGEFQQNSGGGGGERSKSDSLDAFDPFFKSGSVPPPLQQKNSHKAYSSSEYDEKIFSAEDLIRASNKARSHSEPEDEHSLREPSGHVQTGSLATSEVLVVILVVNKTPSRSMVMLHYKLFCSAVSM